MDLLRVSPESFLKRKQILFSKKNHSVLLKCYAINSHIIESTMQ